MGRKLIEFLHKRSEKNADKDSLSSSQVFLKGKVCFNGKSCFKRDKMKNVNYETSNKDFFNIITLIDKSFK